MRPSEPGRPETIRVLDVGTGSGVGSVFAYPMAAHGAPEQDTQKPYKLADRDAKVLRPKDLAAVRGLILLHNSLVVLTNCTAGRGFRLV